MKQITFPMLNLEMNINPVVAEIFGIKIYWYGIIIVASIILAIFLCKKDDGKFKIQYEQILDLCIILIPVAFIGARIYYCIFNINQYTSIWQILNIKDGGLAIYGAIIAGIIVIYCYCKKKRINTLDLLDYIIPYLSLGQAIGRWGNFVNVEAYGIETNIIWKMGIKDRATIKYVHPTFLYESIADFILFIILQKISKNRKFKGEITYIYLIGYSFTRFFVEGLRADSLMLKNYKISQLISAIILVAFCIIMLQKTKKQNKSTKYKIKDTNESYEK